MMDIDSWQARDILAVFERMNRRPGDTLPVRTLWHNLLRRDVMLTGLDWLANAGYVELNDTQTAVRLTEAGYRMITGEESKSRATPTPSSGRRCAIILTALGIETSAILRHLPEYQEQVVRATIFYNGAFENWDIAIAEIGPGNHAAAAISERAIQHFNPQVALFVGVAGGIRDVALGDVVVATKVYGYESGKDNAHGFKPRPDVLVTAHALEQRARAMRQRPAWKSRLPSQPSDGGPHIYVEPIAAGEKVVASTRGATAAFLNENYGDAVAVEIDSAIRSQAHFLAICLCSGIPVSQETETCSTETRFDVASVRRPEAKDLPLARLFGRQIGEANNTHALGERAVDCGFDEIGSEEGQSRAIGSTSIPLHRRNQAAFVSELPSAPLHSHPNASPFRSHRGLCQLFP
jgi:nucleoside phosphorylase